MHKQGIVLRNFEASVTVPSKTMRHRNTKYVLTERATPRSDLCRDGLRRLRRVLRRCGMAGGIFFASILTGCPSDMGADQDPQCAICSNHPPFFEACRSVMVAAGGQPICEQEGTYILCVRPQDCGPPSTD